MKNFLNQLLTVLGTIKRSLTKPDYHSWSGLMSKFKRD